MKKGTVSAAVREAVRRAVCTVPKGVEAAIRRARKKESNPIARLQLDCILENLKVSRGTKPICQDTGLPIFFVRAPFSNDIEAEIYEALSQATEEIPLRPNCVDPLSRKPIGNRPIISWEHGRGDFVEIEFLPKGAGSENMTAFAMLKPSEGTAGLEKFVLQAVLKNAKNACPPIILGIGIGGSSDVAMSFAKKALLRGSKGAEPALEKRLLKKINSLGIGPMGLGGNTTCLDVKIEKTFCHTASLPVAINIQCWAHRHSKVRIYGDGKIEHL